MANDVMYCYKCGQRLSKSLVCSYCNESIGKIIPNNCIENIILIISLFGIIMALFPLLSYVVNSIIVIYLLEQLKVKKTPKFSASLFISSIGLILALSNSLYTIFTM